MKKIAILAYEGCWALSIHLANDFFRIVSLLEKFQGDECSYKTSILSYNGEAVESASGSLVAPCQILNNEQYDIVIIPPIEGNFLRKTPDTFSVISKWLEKYWHSSSVIVTLSTGAYFWAKSGTLTRNHICATHWAFIKRLTKEFPQCTFSSAKPYIKSRNIFSTSTFEACADVLLTIVKEHKGDDFAQLCAAYFLEDVPQKLSPILPNYHEHSDLSIFPVQEWINQNSYRDIKIMDLANIFGFSERNLKRRFTLATGIPINKYIQAVRIDKSKKLLLTTDKTVKEISLNVGYENDGFFSRIFKKSTGSSPAKWRRDNLNLIG